MTPKQTRVLLVAMMVSAGPVLFAGDLVARHFVLDGQPADARELVGGLATKLAWLVVPTPLLGGLVGFWAYPRLFARQAASAVRAPDPAQARHNADLTALMMAASLPQLPALLGDLSVMLGADLTPVVCSSTLSTVMVLLIAVLGRREGREDLPHPLPAPQGGGSEEG